MTTEAPKPDPGRRKVQLAAPCTECGKHGQGNLIRYMGLFCGYCNAELRRCYLDRTPDGWIPPPYTPA
jgi:hypothetical protein